MSHLQTNLPTHIAISTTSTTTTTTTTTTTPQRSTWNSRSVTLYCSDSSRASQSPRQQPTTKLNSLNFVKNADVVLSDVFEQKLKTASSVKNSGANCDKPKSLGMRACEEFARLDALNTKDTLKAKDALDKLADELAQLLSSAISEFQGDKKLEYMFATGTSDPAGVYNMLKLQANNNQEVFASKEPKAEVKRFLDRVYDLATSQQPDCMEGSHTIFLNSKCYLKKEQLGDEGSFGVVHRWESEDKESIAVKTMKPGNKDAKLAEASKEVRALAHAQGRHGNPNVIGFKGVIRSPDGMALIAMESATPVNAYEFNKNLHKFEIFLGDKASDLVKKTLLKDYICGLKHVQEDRGMMHLDVKSPNYFMGTDGRAKLGDFGTAKLGSEDTFTSSPVECPIWLAPEVVYQSRLFSERVVPEFYERREKATQSVISSLTFKPTDKSIPDDKKIKSEIKTKMDEEFGTPRDLTEAGKALMKNICKTEQPGFKITNKADTWSVGIMAYQTFKNADPFESRFQSDVQNMLVEHASNTDNRVFKPHAQIEITHTPVGPRQGQYVRGDGTSPTTKLGSKTQLVLTPEENLINNLLHPEPKERPTLTDVLNNPIFEDEKIGDPNVRNLMMELSKPDPNSDKLQELANRIFT